MTTVTVWPMLDQARQNQANLVILDTPGNDLQIAEAACAAADLILIPCRPSPPDLVSIVPTVKMALASGKPAFVLLNAAPVQGSETAEATVAIQRAGMAVCPVILHSRKAFVSRFHEGMSALDVDPKGKAARELEALFEWTCSKDSLLTNKQVTMQESELSTTAKG